MCDLLGMSFERRISAKITLDVFQLRGEPNPDGWGLAFYDNGQLQVIKEACPATNSPLFDFIERYSESELFLSHVRRSTMGNRSYLNTHPFYRALVIGRRCREWVFAHNGTVSDFRDLPLTEYQPIGDTDSEHIFCHILGGIAQLSDDFYTEDGFKCLHNQIKEINTAESTMNLLFSDGEYLFCYSDENDHNDGLRVLNRATVSEFIRLGDDKRQLGLIDLKGVDTSEPSISGYIVTTRPQTNYDWIDIDPGELLIFRKGSVAYSSVKH